MLTKAMRVRQVFPDDWTVVKSIMEANGVEDFEWPIGAWGALAILDDHTIAFCAGRDVAKGLLIEELWAVPGHDGIRGLSALAEWVENTAQSLATKTKRVVNVGGFIFPSTPLHEAALRKRGYTDRCKVLSKEFTP
jgi:hypothetical protein